MIYTLTVDVPEYDRRRVVISLANWSTPTLPDITVDGPTESPHRYGSERLCIEYPDDPPEERWTADAGLLTLIDLIRAHLFREAYWRETGIWAGPEAPHDPKEAWNDPHATASLATVIPLITLAVTTIVGLVTWWANGVRSERTHLQTLYADAYAAVASYQEFPYTIRRRRVPVPGHEEIGMNITDINYDKLKQPQAEYLDATKTSLKFLRVRVHTP